MSHIVTQPTAPNTTLPHTTTQLTLPDPTPLHPTQAITVCAVCSEDLELLLSRASETMYVDDEVAIKVQNLLSKVSEFAAVCVQALPYINSASEEHIAQVRDDLDLHHSTAGLYGLSFIQRESEDVVPVSSYSFSFSAALSVALCCSLSLFLCFSSSVSPISFCFSTKGHSSPFLVTVMHCL